METSYSACFDARGINLKNDRICPQENPARVAVMHDQIPFKMLDNLMYSI